ncbi:MAG: pitrilysin family protein [Pirellulaceae bacterium]
MQFREHTLDNGLQVVAEVNPQSQATAVGYFVSAGSRDETDEVSGVSHFLEHMVFKGTPTRTAADVNREMDEMGSEANARTSEEHTIYHATVLPEFQQRTVELLCDLMRPSLRDEDFETEKKVILEEIMMYEDEPPFRLHDKCMEVHFGGHPLARSVLGTLDSVGAMTSSQMQGYFQQRYSPANMVLVATGKVDFEQLVRQAEASCGSWPQLDSLRQTPRAADVSNFLSIEKDTATQQYTCQIANGPSAEDDDRFAARLLSVIVGDDSGSRMYWDMVETGLAEYSAMGCYELQGTGVQMTFHCASPEQTPENLRRIHQLQLDVERDGVTAEEVQRAQSKICSGIVLQGERTTSRLFAVGMNWLQRRQYRTTRELVEEYKAVTPADIAAVLEKHPLSRNTTVTIGPLGAVAKPN